MNNKGFITNRVFTHQTRRMHSKVQRTMIGPCVAAPAHVRDPPTFFLRFFSVAFYFISYIYFFLHIYTSIKQERRPGGEEPFRSYLDLPLRIDALVSLQGARRMQSKYPGWKSCFLSMHEAVRMPYPIYRLHGGS